MQDPEQLNPPDHKEKLRNVLIVADAKRANSCESTWRLRSVRNRREFVETGFGALSALAMLPWAGATPLRQTSTTSTYDLPHISLNGWEATILELTFPPGYASPKHTHPGFVLGYVLEGKFKFQTLDQTARVLSVGETFYEGPGEIHLPSGSASATRAARVLVVVFGEKGKERTKLL